MAASSVNHKGTKHTKKHQEFPGVLGAFVVNDSRIEVVFNSVRILPSECRGSSVGRAVD